MRTRNFEQLASEGFCIGVNATNESGFSVLPAGFYNAVTQRFKGLNTVAFFHGSNQNSAFGFEYFCCQIPYELNSKDNAYSVRCVIDCQ